nr:Tn3 family transposase [uncultured Halomonas sp.]
MSGLHETAYPRLKADVSEQELAEIYTPTAKECAFARKHGRTPAARGALLILLKTVQRLGYFVNLKTVPRPITAHILACDDLLPVPLSQLREYDRNGGARQRMLDAIRQQVGIKAFTVEGKAIVRDLAREAATTKQDLADIINVVIEELVRQRFELPGFSTLQRSARQARSTVNTGYFRTLSAGLTAQQKQEFDRLLRVPDDSPHTSWHKLKQEPKKPTNTEVKKYLQHLEWLQGWCQRLPAVDHIPAAKYHHFILEARALGAANIKAMQSTKRYALMILLVHAQLRRAMDDAVDIFVRKMRNIKTKAEANLNQYHLDHMKRMDKLVAQLRDVLTAVQEAPTDSERGARVAAAIQSDPDELLAECEEHMAYAGNNFIPFMLQPYRPLRPLLFNCLELLDLAATSHDQSLIEAIATLKKHRHSRKECLVLSTQPVDVSWLPERWRRLILGSGSSQLLPGMVYRKYFELGVLTQVKRELISGDLAVANSDQYSDYRDQLVDWSVYDAQIADYSAMVDIASDPAAFVAQARSRLSETADRIDRNFPENEYAVFNGEELVIRKHRRTAPPDGLAEIDKQLSQNLPEKNILDILVEAEKWLGLHKRFGPLSGFEGKLDDPRTRFVSTLFCYGCNLGPTQTARSITTLNRRQVSWLNLRHVTEERLEQAIVQVINAYNRYRLPRHWGTGQRAAADGTKWNLYEQNLLSEYHIRYGGYGGVGYYHVSDKYIALFSHFIPCGVYEAIYILDGLIKNDSDIQPDTLHGDTQAQSAPVFGLAYLLGINLMPRIRNLKQLVFYKPDKRQRYEHINALFSETINWQLIETHVPDMLRVALSIKAGKIAPSTVLRRLGTASLKNKLYFAFRELGRVVRTTFLLDYIGSVELRRTIHAETNKTEEFNQFVKWLFFGGEGVIAENIRHEQRKVIKYNHLVANLVILHNVESMTLTLKALKDQGHHIDHDILKGLAPYRTDHINRFGDYTLDFDRQVSPMSYNAKII